MNRLSWVFGLGVLTVGVALYCSTISTAWMIGYGWEKRAAIITIHSGRIAFIYHAPSFLKRGMILEADLETPSFRNFALPYTMVGRRAILSIPLYIPMLVVSYLTWRQRRRHRKVRRGFLVMTQWNESGAR